jgi:hypothetical protein
MVARMTKIMLPQYATLNVYQKQTGHDPWVAHRRADGVPLSGGADATRQHGWAEHLAQPAPFDAKRCIEAQRCIGNGPRFRPETSEKRCAFFTRTLIEKKYRWVCRVGKEYASQIGNRLTAEDSAEVAQEDE